MEEDINKDTEKKKSKSYPSDSKINLKDDIKNTYKNNDILKYKKYKFDNLLSASVLQNEGKSISSGRNLRHDKISNESKIKSGRWNEEEHIKFIEGLLTFGNDWKPLQQYIGTRNSFQIRSHAQKFCFKISQLSAFKAPDLINGSTNTIKILNFIGFKLHSKSQELKALFQEINNIKNEGQVKKIEKDYKDLINLINNELDANYKDLHSTTIAQNEEYMESKNEYNNEKLGKNEEISTIKQRKKIRKKKIKLCKDFPDHNKNKKKLYFYISSKKLDKK